MSSGTYVPFFFGHGWVGEFIPRDMREMAARLRFCADCLDGKAGLLEEQMKLAAQGTEAGTAETAKHGSVHDGPVAESDAP